jgi:HK97 family phage major capsid protein
MRSLKQITEELVVAHKRNAPLAQKYLKGGLESDELTQFRANSTELETLHAEKIDAERSEADTKRDREAAQRMLDEHRYLNEPAGRRVSGAVGQEDGRESRGEGVRPGASIGERFVTSEEFARYRANPRPGASSAPVNVGSLYRGHADEVERRLGPGPDEERALITTPVVANTIINDRLTGIYAPELRELRVRDVLTNGRTASNAIEWVKETGRTNGAAEVAEATSLVTGLKPESGFTLGIDSTPVRTIATLIYITRAALDDADQMQTYIDQLLRRFVAEREDRQLLLGDGVAPNLRGLNATPGILNLNGAYYLTGMPNKLDRLRRAKTRIRIAGRGAASAVMLNPSNLEEFELLKTNATAGNNEYALAGGGPFGAGMVSRLWGMTVVENEDLAVDTAFVLDGRFSVVFDRMDAQVYVTDSNRDLFERNIITILCESRLALAVIRPETVAKVDLVGTV